MNKEKELIDLGELISEGDYCVKSDLLNYEGYTEQDKKSILNHLSNGRKVSAVASVKYCEYCGQIAGTYSYFTDEKWIWATWIIHYLEVHDIRFPEEFIRDVTKNR